MSLDLLILAWIPAIALILFGQWTRTGGGSGLTLAYLVYMSMNHLFGAAIYLFPWQGQSEPETTIKGFAVATVGIWAFAIGGWMVAWVSPVWRTRQSVPLPTTKLILTYVGIGVASFELSRILGQVPTLTAALSGGQQLIVPALGLGCWRAWRRRNMRELALCLSSLVVLPFVTVITMGLIGYGTGAALTVLTFVATFIRPRRYVVPAAICLGYLGLSFWVTYSRDRGDIRDRVWGGDSYGLRLGQLAQTVGNFEWLDPGNPLHMHRINDRLNQNFLVGRAVGNLSTTGAFANGETFMDAALALVPRAIWRDKPTQAGSGNLVARFTGITFAQGTSVGIGHVMEFYVNFGNLGVFGGFGLLGGLLAWLDLKSRASLYVGRFPQFFLYYTPGLALLQVGGSLVELTGSAGATLGLVWLISKLNLAVLRRKKARHKRALVFAGHARAVEA